jgi:hypothetical protein
MFAAVKKGHDITNLFFIFPFYINGGAYSAQNNGANGSVHDFRLVDRTCYNEWL